MNRRSAALTGRAPLPVRPPSILRIIGYWLYSIVRLPFLLAIPRRRFARMYGRFDAEEENHRIDSMRPFVECGQRVLDIGAGNGRFGTALQSALDVEVCGVDVVDYADADIPVFSYDGGQLPFADNSFDVTFLAFVLHHCEDQDAMFREAVRCARSHVIIFEDTYHTRTQRLFVMWNDWLVNRVIGRIKVWKGFLSAGVTAMPLPMTFRSPRQWKTFFERYPVRLIDVQTRSTDGKPLLKSVFCLEVVNAETGTGRSETSCAQPGDLGT